ncbi:MAG: UDP-3-O-(3-hydroxymyristoyl)glucosamine N-acyltransferase [Ignavibacteriaceae bacterium]
MSFKLSDVAEIIGGNLVGDKNLIINNLATIEAAQQGDLTFLYLPSYEKYFHSTKASAILVNPGFNKSRSDLSYIEVNNPNIAFSKILIHYFSPKYLLEGIDESAFIHPTAKIGENSAIGKNVVVSAGCKIGKNTKLFHNTVLLEDVEIGDDSIIFQNVSIREKSKIGSRVIIHPGTVIGSDGFGFFTDEKGAYQKIPQIGIVIIEDDVELGSNVSVDRAELGATIIKRGVKIDNLVQIAHNVIIGEDTVISALTGISGSTKIGNHNIIAGQVGIVGHIETSDNVIIMAKSGISKSITKPGQYFGMVAREFKTAIKLEAYIRNLPGYVEKLNQLESQIKNLTEEIKILKDK